MNKKERTKMIKHLMDVKESIAYLQERVRLSKGIDLEILNKNLQYAVKKEEELCKKVGFGDSTSLSTTSQRLEGKA
jgi:hypothetical protein